MLSQEGRLQAFRLQCGVGCGVKHARTQTLVPHVEAYVQAHSIEAQAVLCLHLRNSAGTSWPGGLAVEQFVQLLFPKLMVSRQAVLTLALSSWCSALEPIGHLVQRCFKLPARVR